MYSQIKFVTPAQRHDGKDKEILTKRVQLYTQKKEENPTRWSGETRNWDKVGSVSLSPDRTGEAV
jgi:hypothetical protein